MAMLNTQYGQGSIKKRRNFLFFKIPLIESVLLCQNKLSVRCNYNFTYLIHLYILRQRLIGKGVDIIDIIINGIL